MVYMPCMSLILSSKAARHVKLTQKNLQVFDMINRCRSLGIIFIGRSSSMHEWSILWEIRGQRHRWYPYPCFKYVCNCDIIANKCHQLERMKNWNVISVPNIQYLTATLIEYLPHDICLHTNITHSQEATYFQGKIHTVKKMLHRLQTVSSDNQTCLASYIVTTFK